MDNYFLYKFEFEDSKVIQGDFTISEVVEKPDPSIDKNLWLDRLLPERKYDVRIQRVKKNLTADKYPCTVLAHNDRVVWLRLENEKAVSLFVKQHGIEEIDPIDKQEWPSYPYSFIFIDCREGRHLIAIKKESAAWRNTDTVAMLLQESLNAMMESLNYTFRIRIKPETLPRNYFEYNSNLIKKHNKKLKRLVIRFKSGKIDKKVEAKIKRSPLLKRLMKEMWLAPSGELVLNKPDGRRVVDKRLVDFQRIIELIMCLGPHSGFGLSMSYEDGEEISCGDEIRLSYEMTASTLTMLFAETQYLFGEYEVNKWLDEATNKIQTMKDEGTTENKPKRKAPKSIREASPVFDF